MAEGYGLPQEPTGPRSPGLRPARDRRRYRRPGHRALAQGRRAAGTEKLMQLTGRQHQQEPLANRLGALAFGTVKFAGREGAELL